MVGRRRGGLLFGRLGRRGFRQGSVHLFELPSTGPVVIIVVVFDAFGTRHPEGGLELPDPGLQSSDKFFIQRHGAFHSSGANARSTFPAIPPLRA